MSGRYPKCRKFIHHTGHTCTATSPMSVLPSKDHCIMRYLLVQLHHKRIRLGAPHDVIHHFGCRFAHVHRADQQHQRGVGASGRQPRQRNQRPFAQSAQSTPLATPITIKLVFYSVVAVIDSMYTCSSLILIASNADIHYAA